MLMYSLNAIASADDLSPATLSARNHLTSELLRTLSRGGCFQANPPVVNATPHPFPLSHRLGALADGLGRFLLDYGAYPLQSHFALSLTGIRSLANVSNLAGPIGYPVLYLRQENTQRCTQMHFGRTSYHEV